MGIKIITKNCKMMSDISKFDKNINCHNFENESKLLDELKENGTVVVLGNFDGVHRGHKMILKNAIEKAKEKGYKTIVYTFNEYPSKRENRITTPVEKAFLIDKIGIDCLYLEEFDNVKDFTPEEFVEKILVRKFNVKEIFCGFNFTFGKGKSGNIKTLGKIISSNYQDRIGLNIQQPVLDSENEVISSTRIRKYIKNTELLKAKELLSHNLIIIGEVIHGKKLGRTIGFPTANLKFENKIYPSFGVYGIYIQIENDENRIYHGVMNIGRNPTVDKDNLSVEAHIFDFDEDIYGKVIMVQILENIRKEVKFNSVAELKEQINSDSKFWRKRIDEKYYDTSKNR